MLGLKQEIEQTFQDNWIESDLHIFGYKFDETGKTSWSMLRVTPLTSRLEDVGNMCQRQEVFTEMVNYASTLHEATRLADLAEEFIRTNFKDTLVSIAYTQGSLDSNIWYVTIQATIFSLANIIPIAYLTDGAGNRLIDDSLNLLID